MTSATQPNTPPAASTPTPPTPATPSASAAPASRAGERVRVARPTGPTSSMEPIAASDFGFEEAWHLLNRAGFGGTPDQVQTLVRWGPKKSVEYLVDGAGAPDEPVEARAFKSDIMGEPTPEERAEYQRALRQLSGVERETKLAEFRVRRQNAERDDREQMSDIQRWWLKRMIETARPLQEKLTLFWHGHFATSYRTVEDSYHLFQQNQLFRKHATGNFGELLFQIIRDPAMLKYLNNETSRKGRPNENLARELMELFSLGVGNYGEQDIKEGARALTGYTFRNDAFVFERNNHDGGGKNILGRSGNLDGDDFVKAILGKRACASFMAAKLYRFFAHDFPTGRKAFDEPAERAVADLASTMLGAKYEVAPVMRRLLLSRHFYDPALRGEQIKSPVQLVVSSIRSMNLPPRDLHLLASALRLMGQEPFFPPSVKGWDGGRAWINTSTFYVRQNMLVFLLTGQRPAGVDPLANQEKFDSAPLLAQLADAFPDARGRDTSGVLDALLRFTLGRTDPAGRPQLERTLAARGGRLTPDVMTDLMLLVSAMPEYQLC